MNTYLKGQGFGCPLQLYVLMCEPCLVHYNYHTLRRKAAKPSDLLPWPMEEGQLFRFFPGHHHYLLYPGRTKELRRQLPPPPLPQIMLPPPLPSRPWVGHGPSKAGVPALRRRTQGTCSMVTGNDCSFYTTRSMMPAPQSVNGGLTAQVGAPR